MNLIYPQSQLIFTHTTQYCDSSKVVGVVFWSLFIVILLKLLGLSFGPFLCTYIIMPRVLFIKPGPTKLDISTYTPLIELAIVPPECTKKFPLLSQFSFENSTLV